MMLRLLKLLLVFCLVPLLSAAAPETMAQQAAPDGMGWRLRLPGEAEGASAAGGSRRVGEGWSVMAHAYTRHDPHATPWFQNATPGIALREDASGWMGGLFCNSYSASDLNPEGSPYARPGTRNCMQSFYAARDWSTDREQLLGLHLMTGLAKGYKRGIRIHQGPLEADLMPLIAPGVRFGPVRLSVLGVHIYHLSLEARL